jgi:hypothetical protein
VLWAFSIFVASILVLIPISASVHLFRYSFATLVLTDIYVFWLLVYHGSFEFQFIWHPALSLSISILGLLYFHLPSTTNFFHFPRKSNLRSYIISGALGILTLVLIRVLDGVFCPEVEPFISSFRTLSARTARNRILQTTFKH